MRLIAPFNIADRTRSNMFHFTFTDFHPQPARSPTLTPSTLAGCPLSVAILILKSSASSLVGSLSSLSFLYILLLLSR